MDKRSKGITLVILSTLLCACPGLCLVAAMGLDAVKYLAPAQFGFPNFNLSEVVVFSCLGIIFILMPVFIWFRNFRPRTKSSVTDSDEPLPPPL